MYNVKQSKIPSFVSFPKLLRVGAFQSDNNFFTQLVKLNNETVYVYEGQFITLLAKALRGELKIFQPPDGQYGVALTNGSWTGMMGMVLRGEVDFALGKISANFERMEAVDFIFPYHFDSLTFITDKPENVPNAFAIFKPFSAPTWMALLMSLLLIQLVFLAFAKAHFFQNTINDVPLKVYGILFERSVEIKSRKFCGKILTQTWIMAAMFVTYSYKAVLLSFVTFPFLTGIQDIEDLGIASEKNSFNCSAHGIHIYNALSNSTNKRWQSIARCIKRSNNAHDVAGFMRSNSYKKAFITTRSNVKAFKHDYFLSDDSFFMNYRVIIVRKDFCCKEKLNQLVHNFAAKGLLQKIQTEEEYLDNLQKINAMPRDKQDSLRKLSLSDLSGAFFLLLSGDLLSLIVFLAEVFQRINKT